MKSSITLDRYALREFALPFTALVAGFSVMLISGILYELSDLIFDKKMPTGDVLEILVYQLPQVIVITLPISTLFATLLGLGRLAKDSEMTAMRAAGVSFRRASLPILFAAAIVCALTLLLNEHVVPESNHRAQQIYRQAYFNDALRAVEENVFFQGPDGRVFFVGAVNRASRQVERVMIFQTEGSPFPSLITAQKGRYSPGVWHLEDGVQSIFDDAGFLVEARRFEKMTYPVPEGSESLLGTQKTTDEMTRAELGEHIRLFKSSGIDTRRFEVEYHLKLADPLSGLLWVLVGAPLSLRSVRSGRFYGAFVSILLAFGYYVSLNLFRSLGWNGVLPPLAAAWMTDAIFLTAGIAAMAKADAV